MNKVEIDMTINPVNCKSKEYVWVRDSIYDPDAPEEANKEFAKLIEQGYILGEPANINTIQNGGVGVYKSISS